MHCVEFSALFSMTNWRQFIGDELYYECKWRGVNINWRLRGKIIVVITRN